MRLAKNESDARTDRTPNSEGFREAALRAKRYQGRRSVFATALGARTRPRVAF
jgi:hypothetical protein